MLEVEDGDINDIYSTPTTSDHAPLVDDEDAIDLSRTISYWVMGLILIYWRMREMLL